METGFAPELSFFEGMLAISKFMMLLVLLGLALSIATLPLFYAVITLISNWLGAREGMESKESSLVGRLRNALVYFVLPPVSMVATFFLISNSGLIDALFTGNSKLLGNAANPTRTSVRNSFESITKSWVKDAQVLDEPESDNDGLNQEKEDLKANVKKQLRGIRSGLTLLLYQLGPIPLLVIATALVVGRRKCQLIVRSLLRNPLRTSLSYIAIFVLSFVLVTVWSILAFLDSQTVEKESNLKALITERYQVPSQMKPSHVETLKGILDELPEENRPKMGDKDIMTWAFVGGTLDPKNRTAANSLFFFCMEPSKVMTMLDGLDDLTEEQKKLLQKAVDISLANPNGIILGKEKLTQLNKRVGDRVQLTSLNYKDIVFDFEILGTFPEGTRYDQSAVMNRDYLYKSLQAYEGTNGKAHPLADKCLNLIWVRLPDKKSFDVLAEKISNSGAFNPAVKIETSSSGISTFLDPFKEMLWGLRYILAPVLMGTMTLIIANAISISVRERRTEMAVLKVLGYPPRTIFFFVVAEAVFIGLLSGFLSSCLATILVNQLFGGVAFPIAFFGKFYLPEAALWWGPAVGLFASVVGSLIPARNAMRVKVTDVFSRVA